MGFLKKGGKLKTTGNARVEVSGKPASVKVPGLPGMKGLTEDMGQKAKMTGKVKPMKVDKDCDGY